jgi:SAM-dependent methyltransferase/DNA-binding HxlR family transcriptional regulator
MRPPESLETRLLNLLAGKWIASAISAAAELGLADALVDGPRDVSELSQALGCEPEGLSRLLRVLAGEGVVESGPQGRYTLTPLGEGLTSDRLRDLARLFGSDLMWRPWSALADALRSGQTAFELVHGEPLFGYLETRPDAARLYHDGVDAFTRDEARALAEAYDFSGPLCVVDVGGGLGTLLSVLSARFAALRCVLYDRPHVVDDTRARLAASDAKGRFECIGGDFFEDDLPEADIFVIKHVLHNWDDTRCLRLLERCSARLRPGGKILVIEGILLAGDLHEPTRLMDLEMLVLCGAGHERSKPEFRSLLSRAGLKLVRTQYLAGATHLIVAEPRSE